jgi:hypothetical protein
VIDLLSTIIKGEVTEGRHYSCFHLQACTTEIIADSLFHLLIVVSKPQLLQADQLAWLV